MLEHQKLILKNLASIPDLFVKELYKSRNWLSDWELLELKKWLLTEYADSYTDVIVKVLSFQQPTYV